MFTLGDGAYLLELFCLTEMFVVFECLIFDLCLVLRDIFEMVTIIESNI